MKELLAIAVAAALLSMFFEKKNKEEMKDNTAKIKKETRLRLQKSLKIKEETKDADIEEVEEE